MCVCVWVVCVDVCVDVYVNSVCVGGGGVASRNFLRKLSSAQ